MRSFLGLLAALFALLGAPLAVRAAAVPSAHASSELVAETTGAAPGSTIWVAVVQTLDKGWHSYWRNPGDAGEPTSIAWTLPAGWRAGDILWPAPERLPVGPLMNYGYEGRVLLPVPFQIPASARPGDRAAIRAKVDYLVCADVCVPGTVTLGLTLPVVGGTPPLDPSWGPAIARSLRESPKSIDGRATFQRGGARLTLAIASPSIEGRTIREAYFFPYSGTLIDHSKAQAIERGPRGLTLSLAPAQAARSRAPDAAISGVVDLDGRVFEVTASQGQPPPGSAGLGPPPPPAAPAIQLLLAMGGAFLGGLILNLMPCVFPVLSMKAAALAGHGSEATAARLQGLAFLGGVLASFLALAAALITARAAGASVGWGFQLQSPATVALLALVMLAAALNLSGLFEIGTSAQGLGAGLASRGALVGSALTGVLAVVVAAPCTAPFMGPALFFALTQPAPMAAAVFLALAIGFGAPFTLLSMSPSLIRRLPRPGPWMDVFRKALSFPMYAAAAWLAWVLAQQGGPEGLARLLAAAVALAFGAWLFGAAQRLGAVRRGPEVVALSSGATIALAAAIALVAVGAYGSPAGASAGPTAGEGEAASQPWSPERLAALRAAHRPVLVNFTAAWCVTCQVNERVALSAPEVTQALRRANAAYLVADWTNRDPAIARALAAEGRVGVPLYLVYGADGGEPVTLPQLLTPSIVARALDAAAAARRPGELAPPPASR